MEITDVPLPLPSNSVSPYSDMGGWGYLTAGTLFISTKNKSYGLFGQGTGNTYALSANYRSMTDSTCYATKYMAVTIYPKVYNVVIPTLSSATVDFKVEAFGAWDIYFGYPTTPSQSSITASIGGSKLKPTFGSLLISYLSAYYYYM